MVQGPRRQHPAHPQPVTQTQPFAIVNSASSPYETCADSYQFDSYCLCFRTTAAGAAATLTQRLPTLAQVADTAVFMASDRAGAMTGTVVNLSCGAGLDVRPDDLP